MMETLFFYLFSILTLGGGVLMITRRNVVISGVWLIASLLGVAGLFLLQGAEFLFVAQMIVYIGGVVLLLLVALMLLNLDANAPARRFRGGWPIMAGASGLLALEVVLLLARSHLPSPVTRVAMESNTGLLADVLFSRYLVSFEIVSLILLVAIVGAVLMGQPKEEF
jgi:NADH-quinone oxidoreductase subunit J